MKATPGPWRTRKEKRSTLVCDEYGNQIALIRPVKKYGIEGDTEANARFIVTACNNFDEMLEALKYFVQLIEDGIDTKIIRQTSDGAFTQAQELLARIEGGE